MSIDKELAMKFAEVFRGRTDAWGAVGGACHRETVTLSHYTQHLEGKTSLGIYMMLPDDTCWWGVHDYDHEDSETPLLLMQALSDLGVNRGVYLERTKSLHWRVWLLFDAPVHAPIIRRILKAAIEKAGAPRSIECFPKQDTLAQIEVGNYVNIPYFGRGRRRVIVDPTTLAEIPIAQFVKQLQRFPAGLVDLLDLPEGGGPQRTLTATAGPRMGGWHPCVEGFLASGATANINRNGALFTFCKHLNAIGLAPAAIEQLALSVNGNQTNPLDEREVRRALESALNGKGGTGYTSLGCEDPLWAPFYCSPEAQARCRVAKESSAQEGIAIGQNFSIVRVVMQRSRPPVFTVTINGVEINLSREQFVTFRQFRAIVGPEIKRYPLLPKKVTWESLLDNLFQHMEIAEAPDDASESSGILEAIERYLHRSAWAEDITEMALSGRPLREEGVFVFTGEGLTRTLKNMDITVNRAHLWHIVHAMGGTSTVRRQGDKLYRCWAIPRTQQEGRGADEN